MNFTPRFNLKNKSKVREPWKKRQGRVAAFCREELIDDDQYWSFLSKLLKSNSSHLLNIVGGVRFIRSGSKNIPSIQIRCVSWGGLTVRKSSFVKLGCARYIWIATWCDGV